MKLATTTGDFGRYTNDQMKIFEYIKQAGFSYVDYNFGIDFRNRSGVCSSDWKSYVKKINECCNALDIKLVQSHSPMGAPLEDNNDEFIANTKKCIEACSDMGIDNIVIHSGYLPGITKKENFEKNKVFFEKLLPTAEQYEVNILVENFNKMWSEDIYWIDNATDLLYLIEYVNHPLFHAVWDTGHANLQEMPQEEEIALLGHHLKALHVHDNYNDDQHMCPLFGTLDMSSVARGLKKVNYDGYFTFEADNIFNLKTVSNSNLEIDLALRIEAEKMLKKIGDIILDTYFK